MAVIDLWNKITEEVATLQSINAFKHAIKRLLI